MKIYLVIGTSGEYSDREEHPVCAYIHKDEAEEHVRKATEWRQKNQPEDKYVENTPHNPFDYECVGDNGYYEVSWFISECELRTELPA